MEQTLHLNWSLSAHITNQRFEEAIMVMSQMSDEELIESKTSTEILKKNFNKFKTRYKFKTGSQLNAKDFINKKLELLTTELTKRNF
jgi:hypothetical protein